LLFLFSLWARFEKPRYPLRLHIRTIWVSRDSIGKYERNDIMPTADKAKKMADILGVSLDFLMSDAVKEDTVIDNDMLYRMQEVQKLPDSEKDKINSIIDAFVRDTKAKQAFRIS
jgi:transcriptional regulator with XRE-family HTH domain